MERDVRTADFRSVNRSNYPELGGYAPEDVYRDSMGGGALYMAVQMLRTMRLHTGDVVLDLGCGGGETSIYMAQHCGVRVVSVDLWTTATFLNDKFRARGCHSNITPLQLDIRKELPFAVGYFDAIFCMNSFSFYGGSQAFLQHLLPHLKNGGELCIGMESLNGEFTAEQRANPPDVYNYYLPGTQINVWEGDFSKMHSPTWWAQLFRDSGQLDVRACFELPDADVLYEDLVLYNIAHDLEPDDVERSIAQIRWGRANHPRKTLFVLTAVKRAAEATQPTGRPHFWNPAE